MFATSQEASFTHSASNIGLFVKLLLVARVKESLNGLEVYPYIYVVTRQIPVCSLPRISNVYHLAIYVAQAPELSLVHRSPWEETIAKYFSGKTDSLTRLTYYYKITCTIKTTLIGWYWGHAGECMTGKSELKPKPEKHWITNISSNILKLVAWQYQLLW